MSARGEQTETTEDLFHENVFFYKFARAFWEDLCYWLFPKFNNFSELTKENVIFGIFIKY